MTNINPDTQLLEKHVECLISNKAQLRSALNDAINQLTAAAVRLDTRPEFKTFSDDCRVVIKRIRLVLKKVNP